MVQFHFDFWDALLLCGVVQGIVMSVLAIIGKNSRGPASWFLSATLLIFALHNVLILIFDTQLSSQCPLLGYLPLNLILGFGPCIYFYTVFSLAPLSKPRLFPHFIPVGIQFCYHLLRSFGLHWYIDYPTWKLISQTEQVGALASVCVYSFLALKIIRSIPLQGRTSVLQVKSSLRKGLHKLLLSYALLWMIWLLYTLADIFLFDYQLHIRDYFPLYLLVAALTYWIGIMAYLHPIGFVPDTGNKTYSELDQQETDINLSRLQKLMEEGKLYLDPELDLKLVAGKTGIPINLISFLLNNKLNSSFSEWVNSFRIEAVKKQMTSSRFKEITIAGIAAECGFNSKATFNRVFKQQTGMTPSEYLRQIKNDVS